MMMRLPLPQPGLVPLNDGESKIARRRTESFSQKNVVTATKRYPNTWRHLWFIISGTIPHFLVGRAYANWLSYKNPVQYTQYLTFPIQEIFDPVGYRAPRQFRGQSWLHLRLRQASRELSRIIVGLSLHSDGERRPTPLTTISAYVP